MRRIVREHYHISKIALRRRIFMFGAAAGAVSGIISAWQDWRSGLFSSLPQDITLTLVLVPLFF